MAPGFDWPSGGLTAAGPVARVMAVVAVYSGTVILLLLVRCLLLTPLYGVFCAWSRNCDIHVVLCVGLCVLSSLVIIPIYNEEFRPVGSNYRLGGGGGGAHITDWGGGGAHIIFFNSFFNFFFLGGGAYLFKLLGGGGTAPRAPYSYGPAG